MRFNLLKILLGRNYRPVIDAGKRVAPIAEPLVQAFLTSKGLPITPGAALGQLTASTSPNASLPADLAVSLQDYVAAHLPKQ